MMNLKTTYTIADKSTLDSVTADVNKMIEVANEYIEETPTGPYKDVVRYGIKIKKSDSNPATRMEYTYDAVGMTPAKMNYTTGAFDYGDWEKVWFITDNKPVMLKSDGTEDYELDPNDYSKKADGSASDYNNLNYDGNVMARIPLVYVSMSEDSTYEYITVSNVKCDDTFKAIAHTKSDGTVVDNIYLSCFNANVINDKARSLSGRNSTNIYRFYEWTDYATANGSGWNIGTWGQRMLINSLLWIIGKSDNTQEVFGQGNTSGYNSSATYKGMLTAGTLYNKGQFYGSNDTTTQVKVFHIEGWWGDRYKFIHGIMSYHGEFRVSFTGPYNNSGTGYTSISGPYKGSGYGSTTMTNEYGRFATAVGGSGTTYTCDYWYRITSDSDARYANVAGYCNSGSDCGASYISIYATGSDSSWNYGASLSFV